MRALLVSYQGSSHVHVHRDHPCGTDGSTILFAPHTVPFLMLDIAPSCALAMCNSLKGLGAAAPLRFEEEFSS